MYVYSKKMRSFMASYCMITYVCLRSKMGCVSSYEFCSKWVFQIMNFLNMLVSLVVLFLLDFSQLVEGDGVVLPRQGNDSFVKKSQRFWFVSRLEDWDDDAVLAFEGLVFWEGDGLKG